MFCARATSGMGAGDRRVLARVNDDVITAGEFARVAPVAAGDSAALASRERLLDQMVNQKLIVQWAKELGYDETLAGAVDKKRADALRASLQDYAARLKPDPQDIAWESTLFATDAHLELIEVSTYDTAMLVGGLLQQGVPFETLALRYNRFGKGGPTSDLGFVSLTAVPTEVARAVLTLAPGQASPLLMVQQIRYDYIKVLAKRPAVKPESARAYAQQVAALAAQRKKDRFLGAIRDQVQYDEAAMDYLTRHADSLRPEDGARVVARWIAPTVKAGGKRDTLKVRMDGLLPVVRRYGVAYPEAKRKALKEDITNDVMEREALRLGLDKAPEFRTEFARSIDAGIYQYFYSRMVNDRSLPSDSEIGDHYREHPEEFAGSTLERAHDVIKMRLFKERQPRRYSELVSLLRARARVWVDRELLAGVKPTK
jgi:hypothetical protein